MQRRDYLKLVGSTAGGLAVGTPMALAADAELDCGVWHDGEITDTIDGDTFDVRVDSNGTQYNVRTLGHDTPEKSGNTRYDKTEEWEFIEDAAHLEDWGNRATQFAKDELPVGTQVQIKLDCESDEIDQYGRLLAKIRYDRDGDGVMDTVWNELTVEQGYARVYSASLTNADEYFDLERAARANGVGVWSGADGSAPEWRNRDVAETFHPHTSSIKTTKGKLPDSRAPVWAEADAVQENTSRSTVKYNNEIPLVGVDEATNVAYFGGCTINEAWEDQSSALEHFVFVTNLIDYLHDSSDPSGPVLVDGGHHTFGQDNAVSAEDTAFYQRYLEGVGIELHGIHTYGNGTGYSLSEARALVASAGPDQWTSAEISEVNGFLDDGGVLLLMGSGSETAEERINLDDLAAGVGTDLRLNVDDVRDDTNNVGDRKLLKTANLNTSDFSLWSAYGGSSGGGGSDESVVEFGTVNQYPHDGLNDEYVEVVNSGSSDQDMTGWTLENGDGEVYAFPDGFTLGAGDTVRVHTGSGTDSSTDLYWGSSAYRWDNDEDAASLFDDQGSLVRETSWALDDVIIPAIDADNEWVDFENVGDSSVDMTGWRVEDGAGNTYDFPDSFSLASGATVRLHTGSGTDSSTDLYWGTSYVWNNDGDTAYLYDDGDNLVQTHEYPAPYSASVTEVAVQSEYVDVTNEGSSPLDVSGWTLSDEAGYTYEFPDSFTLGAGDSVRVHTGEGEDTRTDLYWGMGISVWNDDGDTAFLYDDNTRLADQQSSGDSGGGSCGSKLCVGQVNEDGSTLNEEWVEFDNTGSSDQDMTGWSVEDGAGYTYTFPDNYTLTSGATVRLHTGSGTDSSTDGDLYWGSGSYVWNNSGDTVYLYEPDGTLHTEKTY